MNARGQYGSWSNGYRGTPLVGLIHTPQDTEDEINQLHNEIMQFGDEAAAKIEDETNRLKDDAGYQAIRAKWKAAEDHYKSIKSKPSDELRDRVARALGGIRHDDLTQPWIRDFFRVSDPALAKDLDLLIQKIAAVKRMNEIGAELADNFNRRAKSSALLTWKDTIWSPFSSEWVAWRSQKVDVPAQMWPGSGAWDRTQDYRAKYIELRNKAPFKAAGPTPIAPEARRDPSLLGGLASFGSGFKWVVLGVLGIGGVVAVSAIASNLKKGRRS